MDKQKIDPAIPASMTVQSGRFKAVLFIIPTILILFIGLLALVHFNKPSSSKLATASKKSSLVELGEKDIKNAAPGEEKALAYIRQANNFNNKNDSKRALEAYLAADKTWPNHPEVISNIADAYFNFHDKDNAIKYYKQAISLVNADSKSDLKSNVATWQATITQVQTGNFEITDDMATQ